MPCRTSGTALSCSLVEALDDDKDNDEESVSVVLLLLVTTGISNRQSDLVLAVHIGLPSFLMVSVRCTTLRRLLLLLLLLESSSFASHTSTWTNGSTVSCFGVAKPMAPTISNKTAWCRCGCCGCGCCCFGGRVSAALEESSSTNADDENVRSSSSLSVVVNCGNHCTTLLFECDGSTRQQEQVPHHPILLRTIYTTTCCASWTERSLALVDRGMGVHSQIFTRVQYYKQQRMRIAATGRRRERESRFLPWGDLFLVVH